MKDVVAHLKGKGFPIIEYDERSFIVELQNVEPRTPTIPSPRNRPCLTISEARNGVDPIQTASTAGRPYKSNMYVTLSPPNALTLPSIIFSF